MLRWILFGVAAALLGGCTTISWNSSKQVQGNSTGGFVPALVTSDTVAAEEARRHCAQYSLVPRITSTHTQTGGDTVFVCEKPGQAPPPQQPVASYPGQNSPGQGSPGQNSESYPGQRTAVSGQRPPAPKRY
jgi:hypothetical protein